MNAGFADTSKAKEKSNAGNGNTSLINMGKGGT